MGLFFFKGKSTILSILKASKMDNKVKLNNSFNLKKKILFKGTAVRFIFTKSNEGNKPKNIKYRNDLKLIKFRWNDWFDKVCSNIKSKLFIV